MSKKKKKVFVVLNYIEHWFILVSAVTGGIVISAFASLIDILIGITSSTIGLKICVIIPGIKKYKAVIKKKKHHKIVLSAKFKLNSREVLISKFLIDRNISHDRFLLINSVLKEYDGMKEEIKNSNDKIKFKLYVKQCYQIVWSV